MNHGFNTSTNANLCIISRGRRLAIIGCMGLAVALSAFAQDGATKPAARAATSSAPARPLPAWAAKVQLHNFAGAEATEDGLGVNLYRLPKEIRDQMTEKNKESNKTGADMMLSAHHSEIRFVLNAGEKPENVKIHVQTTGQANATFFWGDVMCHGTLTIRPGKTPTPVSLFGHGLLYSLMDQFPHGRFSNHVCRIVLDGSGLTLTGIDGDIRPPKPEELAPVMMSYGTSITEGWAATRSDLAWNALAARELGYDLVNLGCSGTAFCEPAVADYIAKQPWELCVLEISVNMVGNFSTEEFRKRADYMIDTLAKSHPTAPIVCISIFPFGTGDLWKNPKVKEFREALEAACKASPHKNVHFVPGPDLLSYTGLSEDLLHPSDHGEIEIAQKLAARIRQIPGADKLAK